LIVTDEQLAEIRRQLGVWWSHGELSESIRSDEEFHALSLYSEVVRLRSVIAGVNSVLLGEDEAAGSDPAAIVEVLWDRLLFEPDGPGPAYKYPADPHATEVTPPGVCFDCLASFDMRVGHTCRSNWARRIVEPCLPGA
jgi:hypothetical protein